MTIKTKYMIECNNGAVLLLPPDPLEIYSGMIRPDVYSQSSGQLYPINSLLWFPGTGAKFRYSYAAGTLAGTRRLVINGAHAPGVTGHENDEGFEGAPSANQDAADLEVSWASDDSRAVNYYAGGHLAIYSTVFQDKYIISGPSTAGTTITVKLADGLDSAITTSTGITAYPSPYKNVKAAASMQAGFETFIGVPLIAITSGYWFWLQTAGPVIVTPTGGTWPGSAANYRSVYANPADGTIQPAALCDPSSGYQKIGDLIMATGGTGSDYGDLYINLDLDMGH